MYENLASAHLCRIYILMTACKGRKVEFLSKEAISRVMNAEEKANDIRARAQVEARERVAACEADCTRENAEAVARMNTELKARLNGVRERSEALIAQSREEADTDIQALRASAAEKMREAVKHIEWELCDI